MIGISKLYCGTVEPSDALRYKRQSKQLPSHLLQFSEDKKPVIVWNVTRRCNLSCVHCYARSDCHKSQNELTTEQGLALLEDLSEFGSPVILFSGGEPLMRPDLLVLIERAIRLGMRAVISTNGTLIDQAMAERFARIGLSYVGISIDGMQAIHDRFRGQDGAFAAAMKAVRHCRRAGVKVGLRFTINRQNMVDVPDIFKLVVDEDIPRICFYHLVYAGRGSELIKEDLNHRETREMVDFIIEKTEELHQGGMKKEILTVDNHADGPYVYLRLLEEKNEHRANEVMELLEMNGGNSSGQGIGCVSWDGRVHPDQFWRHYSIGNVKHRKFSEIWTDMSDPLLEWLRNRKPYLLGRCGVCRFQGVCNGNFRVRAEAMTGDLWAPDPACYLSYEEILPQ